MIGYQQQYRPAYAYPRMAQGSTAPAGAPPPPPDMLFTGYTGVPGFFEVLAVLTVTSAAAWVGIRTGMKKTEGRYVKIAGWVGGIGAGLFGLLYLGAKSGVGQIVGIPAVRVSPT